MKLIFKLLFFVILMACSSAPATETSDAGVKVSLQLKTTGIYNFENYIHTLTIYAFSRSSTGYSFYKTLAQLDAEGIKSLQNMTNRGDAKLFSTTLPIGDYEIYFVANAAKNDINTPQIGISKPSTVFLTCPSGKLDSIYFLGSSKLKLLSDMERPVTVELNRAVSKLIITLYGVPEPIDSVLLSVRNIASQIRIDGSLSTDSTTMFASFVSKNKDIYRRDTLVCEMLTFPTTQGVSGLDITFYSQSGQKKVKKMPSQVLLPNKFILLTGKVDDSFNGLLNFEIEVTMLIFDTWRDQILPDFPIQPY